MGLAVQTTVLACLAAVVGVISAYAALAFVVLIRGVQELLLGVGAEQVAAGLGSLPGWRLILAPAAVGLVVGLMVRYALPGQRHHGPADAVEAARLGEGVMSLRTGVVSAVASVLSIGAGASVGRYGPAVHLGASLGAWLAGVFHMRRSARIGLLGAGVAAAIAAAFHAPLAGALFAHEVVLGRFSPRAVMPVVVGAAAGAMVVRVHGSPDAIFALPDVGIQHAHEYPLFVLVGLLGGGLALVFMRSMDFAAARAARLPVPLVLRPVLGGVGLGFMVMWASPVYGLGEAAIQAGLTGQYVWWLLLALIPLKVAATSLSLGFGFSGGVLGPALFLGTMLGMLCGLAVGSVWPEASSPAAVYGVAGMGAVVSRVVGAPIATILIVFELTSSYTLTTGAMIAIVVAATVRSRYLSGSFFDHQLRSRGVDPEQGPEVRALRTRRVEEVMVPVRVSADPGEPVARGLERLLGHRDADLYLVDEQGMLAGRVSLFSLVSAQRAGRAEQPLAELAEAPAATLDTDADLHQALLASRRLAALSLPVLEPGTRRLVGLVHETALLGAYEEAVNAARLEERDG